MHPKSLLGEARDLKALLFNISLYIRYKIFCLSLSETIKFHASEKRRGMTLAWKAFKDPLRTDIANHVCMDAHLADGTAEIQTQTFSVVQASSVAHVSVHQARDCLTVHLQHVPTGWTE